MSNMSMGHPNEPKFALVIQLGNAAMQTGPDVANALLDVVDALGSSRVEGSIRDENGNTVGSWELDEIPAEDREPPAFEAIGFYVGDESPEEEAP